MARTVLIVDDNAINRQILMIGLRGEYDLMEAVNGQEAMDIIKRRYSQLSAVLLDIMMPVMDGFEVLRRIRSSPMLSQLPVIVVTGSDDEETRLRALELGANDFVHKPYNPEIIRHCLKNNIALRETASIVNAIQKDKLTGIYNREFFFEKAGELIQSRESGFYVLAAFDIDNFKLINDRYGASEGDRILRHIGSEMQSAFDRIGGVCGRISGDNFAALFPNTPEAAEFVQRQRETRFIQLDTKAAIHFSVGRYVVADLSLPVSALYDRAYIAKSSVKGRYDAQLAYFDDSMLQSLVREQEIAGEMDRALKNREFEVWLQPQYNHSTGAIIVAEALARWRHPEKGLYMPGEFIPVFEKNGFVYALDRYIWEETCRLLRRWLDEGREPLPVSVNISRYDVFRDDLEQVLLGLIESYRVPAELLRLEITESAFTESSQQIIAAVKRFIELGFTVEIDDFGSGYSSLNTLKDVPAQILKLDMRFLENSESAQRGGNILESITRMARWLGMAVIAEGVETVGQADFLKSIGCNYVQGYLYARPMPPEEYEKLARSVDKEERLITLETVENLDSDSFWNPNSMDTLVFNSFVGGACVFEYCRDKVELLRINGNYLRELGAEPEAGGDLSSIDLFNYLDERERCRAFEAVEGAISQRREQTCELVLPKVEGLFDSARYIRCTLRVIARAGERHLFYCVISNITAQRQAERKEREAEAKRLAAAEQLRAIIGNIEGGVTAFVNRGGVTEYIFANDRFFELLGLTREEYNARFSGALEVIHPEDRERVEALSANAGAAGGSYSAEYRVIRGDGTVRWLRSSVKLMEFPEVAEPVQLAVTLDITEQAEAGEQLRFLNDMAHDLLSRPDAEGGLNLMLGKLREYFGGSRAYIFEFNFIARTADNTYEACAEGVTSEKNRLQKVPLEVMSFWLEAFEKQSCVVIEDISALGDERREEREILRAQGISSIFAVPLNRDGSIIGLIGIDDPQKRYAQMNKLVALGDYIAVMLTRRDLNARISEPAAESYTGRRGGGPGIREYQDMEKRPRLRPITPEGFLRITLLFCALLAALLVFFRNGRERGGAGSFSEPVLTLDEGWTLSGAEGRISGVSLPLTVPCSPDGEYTLSLTLPYSEELIASPAMCLYSNYMDIRAELDGEELYSFSGHGRGAERASGNTYHFIRLPMDYAGRTLTLRLGCQLGEEIDYLIKAPVVGSKATMLQKGIMESLPCMLLSGCMLVLALMLGLLYLLLRKKLKPNSSTAYTAIFAILFSVYVFCETSFAQLTATNGYTLFCCTLMLLALLPIPLIGLFSEEISPRFRAVPIWLMGLCSVNLLGQMILNYTGVLSFRSALPATHFTIIASISVMVVFLILGGRGDRSVLRRKLLPALPMIGGGLADIILLALRRPSFNNSLWFTLGVTAFIVIQFCGFVRDFFILYRVSLEAGALRNMAYRDSLTDIGNRNAYERKLKELSGGALTPALGCLVLDINDLKQINDSFGHSAGDAAIVETSRILCEILPENASCFRTGGDEFVVLLEGTGEKRMEELADRLGREAEKRGRRGAVPLSLAVGWGCYEPEDGGILDFIRRVDTLMYTKKHEFKSSPSYPFRREGRK